MNMNAYMYLIIIIVIVITFIFILNGLNMNFIQICIKKIYIVFSFSKELTHSL